MAKTKKTTRRILFLLIALVIVLVILGVAASVFLKGRNKGIEVETARAEIRSITQVVTSSGKVQPEVEVVISPDVSGEIIALPIKEGDQVRQGDLLARIKPDFYQAQVEQADAGVLQSKAVMEQRRADLLNAEAEMKRQERLFERQVISESVYEQAKTLYDVARAGFEAARFAVESAQARQREVREQLYKTTLFAPMNGTISQLNVELGERVVGTSQMAGTTMMRIARLDQMEIEVDVNENDVVNVSLGDSSSIEIDAYPEQSFRGIVTEIANSARVTGAGTQEQVTNFPVKIRIVDPHNAEARLAAAEEGGRALQQEIPVDTPDAPSFRPGMSGTVDIFTTTVPDVVTVPIQAVTVRDFNTLRLEEEDGGEGEAAETAEADVPADDAEPLVPAFRREDLRKVVFLVEEDKARIVEVETGIADDLFIEVKKGLSGGETVVTGPYRVVSRSLEPGDEVKPMDDRRRGGPPTADSD